MSIDERKLEKILDNHARQISTLIALAGGLLSYIHNTQGDEGLAVAKQQINSISGDLKRTPGVRLDETLLKSLLQNAQKA